MSEIVTSDKTKRLIYFIGHKEQKNSALVTKVCKNYETVSTLLNGECATRTLSNLYNLHAVRGNKNFKGELIFDTSMSGPHHYLGWIDPTKSHTIDFNSDNTFRTYREYKDYEPTNKKIKLELDSDLIVKIKKYNWIKGLNLAKDLSDNSIYKHIIKGESKQYAVIENNRMLIKDSLFDSPGILELNDYEIIFPIITEAYNYDLTSFGAQVVPNDEPFAFNQDLIKRYQHAQHKLRVVTYNYGQNYVQDYLMGGSGIFIEKHEFIQAITPINTNCGGYVILGRETLMADKKQLELIAVTIPFGYTLLVEVGAIHGDSTLTGLYMMAMTGNHNAMKTADTVFMKHISGKNVKLSTDQKLPSVPTLPGTNFLLTSDKVTLNMLKQMDSHEKTNITKTLDFVEGFYWKPVILTGTPNTGWAKTLGLNLPK